MQTKAKLCLALSTALGMSLFAAPAIAAEAQSPAGEENGGIGTGEIIVTAQKRAQNLQDVPLAISVVSGAQLERANVNSAEQ
ncbi:hypothetical protein, partial [Haemophilus parainfluenzae]